VASKKKFKKIATGVYQDQWGIRAVVDVAAGRKTKRFDRGTPLREIQRWRNQTKVKLEIKHPQRRPGVIGRGTFSSDVKRYLKHLTIASWKSRRSELRAWEAEFGRKKRRLLTSDHVRAVVKLWADKDVPPKTILNRVRALTAMYHALDGGDAWTPADGVRLPRVVKRKPIHVTVETIRDVEAKLREAGDAKMHARFMVLAATGARPVHLKRAKAIDVNISARLWNVPSAKGGEPVELWLNDDMLAAWDAFIAADAWGDFDATEYAKAVRAAGWPEGVPPYNAKHSFGRALGERGVDLETIRDWFGHTDTDTTRIYTGGPDRETQGGQ
jgi:site-specific recombinase XerD